MARNLVSLLTFPDTGIFTGGDVNRKNYIPNPSEYSVQESDVSLNAKRSTNAILHNNYVRKNIYTVNCSWQKLTEHQVDLLRVAFASNEFSLKFRHNNIVNEGGKPVLKSRFTTAPKMYVDANRTFELVSTDSDSLDYWSVSLSFVEV